LKPKTEAEGCQQRTVTGRATRNNGEVEMLSDGLYVLGVSIKKQEGSKTRWAGNILYNESKKGNAENV
jgi:hypothetical protein